MTTIQRLMARTTDREGRRSGRRPVNIILASALLLFAVASPAQAATYRIGATRYDSNCGVSTSSMVSNFVADAYHDGSTKVDFLNLKQSARIYLPSSCPVATKICLSARITAHTKSGGFTSSATFGAWGHLWDNYNETRSGNAASAFGTKCASINTRSATITAHADNYTAFIYTGGYYKLADYKYEVRVRWYGGGQWHYGAWAPYYKTM